MAEAAVACAAKWIGSLLIQKVKSLHAVQGQVEDMLADFRQMQCFVRDADKQQHEDDFVRDLVVEIRNVAYEAEDVIARFVFEVESRRRGGVWNIFMRYACIFNEVIALNSIGSEIKTIKRKIARLTANLPLHVVVAPANERGGPSSASHGGSQLRRTYSHVVEEDFIGFKDDIKILVQEVLGKGDKQHRVVSICGMGGLGKTTLARKVYHHEEVKKEFKAFAWVSISQQWQPTNVFQGILKNLHPSESPRIANMAADELPTELVKIQLQKKCLIVLDDIWSQDAWNSLSAAFPNKNVWNSRSTVFPNEDFPDEDPGSRIILTTRDKSVAVYVDPQGFIQEPLCLSPEDSWKLFQMKAKATDLTDDLKKLGREMVAKCGGLPLAIVVLGGLIATKPTLSEWKAVHQNLGSYLARGTNIEWQFGSVFHVLDLSYRDLPYQLKVCFLYLGHYPEDADIDCETLYQLWMAEGLLSQEDREDEESKMDEADRYMGELEQRCIVQVKIKRDNMYSESRKTCRLRTLMRDLCLLKAKEEDFIEVLNYRQTNEQVPMHLSSTSSSTAKSIGRSNRSKIHRLAAYQGENGNLHLSELEKTIRHIRSVFFFMNKEVDSVGPVEEELTRFFKRSKILRTIHFQGSDLLPIKESGIKIPEEIGKLILLRHLSICGATFTKVPSSIGNLRYLETLDLRASTYSEKIISVPNVLWKLKELIHLYLPRHMTSEDGRPLRLDGLNKLETLANVYSGEVDFTDFCKLTNLRILRSVAIYRNFEDLAALNDCVSNCKRLQEMSILISAFDVRSEEVLRLLRQLLSSPALVILVLHEIEGEMVDCTFGNSLTTLRLDRCGAKGYPMASLENLPNLQFLQYNRPFGAQKMVCSAGGFQRLEHLMLWDLEIEEWRVEHGAMPKLSFLQIFRCKNLQMLPDGLRFISTLKTLHIRGMPESFKKTLLGVDYHKFRHIPEIAID